MGRQVNFYLHGEDQNEFDALLRSCGNPVILPFYYPKNQVFTVPNTLMRNKEKEGERVYLVRLMDFPEMQLEYNAYYGNWYLKEFELPVLHYDRCSNTESEIYRGRLWFQLNYRKNMEWAFHSEEFIKWANSVINKARRKLKKIAIDPENYNYQAYVGKSAASWIEKNRPALKGEGTLIAMSSRPVTD